MGLLSSFGWRAREKRESYWIDDPAFEGVSVPAAEAWLRDAEARHLEPFIKNGTPTRLEYRALDGDEERYVNGLRYGALTRAGAVNRMWRLGFRIAMKIEDMPAKVRGEDGADHSTTERVDGLQMLASWYVDELDKKFPGIVDFYGFRIVDASTLTEPEKKASSPPSTPTPSAAEEITAATTEASPPTAGA